MAGHPGYSKEELSALRGIFALYDPDGSGAISVRELEGLLQKIGHSTDSAAEILKAADAAAGGKADGVITFDEFLELLQKGQPDQPGEQPDPKASGARARRDPCSARVLTHASAMVCAGDGILTHP